MARRTVTMNWDRLDDFNDDNDEFYESTNRLSAVVPLDMPLPEIDYDNDDDDHDDDQEFNDTRVSFSQNLAAYSFKDTKPTHNLAAYSIKEIKPSVATPVSNAQYDMWMVAPGSITGRRRRLLQDMGLNSRKDFSRLASTTNPKLNKAYTKRQASTKPFVTSLEKTKVASVVKESSPHLNASKQVEQKHTDFQPNSKIQTEFQVEQSHAKLQPLPESQPQRHQESQAEGNPKPQPQPQEQNHAPPQSQSVLLVRSRSDSDIDTSSFNTKRRKEEIIGLISKQRLTRTASGLVTPSGGLSCLYANIVRVSKPNTKLPKNSSTTTSNTQLDSFFLIKNLDTGKEFVVKESNEEGMWNKVSDLQTGKQLTMDEFENTVGHSPVVKELMRRTSRKKNGSGNSKLAATNSYLSKSFRNSKRKGAAILKSLKDSMSGSKSEREKDDCATETTTTATTTDCKLDQKNQIELHTKPKAEAITSADSRVRILDGLHVVNKLIGYRNTSSQLSAQYSADGKYVICASEDSQVYIWKHEKPKSSGSAKPKYVTTTSYEHFPCTDVTVAVPWSGSSKLQWLDNESKSKRDVKKSGPLALAPNDNSLAKKSSQLPPVPKKSTDKGTNEDSKQTCDTDSSVGESGDGSLQPDGGNNAMISNSSNVPSTAWGLVIVTAGVSGEIRVYQNVGLPVKVGTNLF
ncbi:WD repeat-containing protein 44-like protein [Tanacetum coccineum]